LLTLGAYSSSRGPTRVALPPSSTALRADSM
jgi:hypothetical protein